MPLHISKTGKLTYPSKQNKKPYILCTVYENQTQVFKHIPQATNLIFLKLVRSLIPFMSTKKQGQQKRHSRKIYKPEKHTQKTFWNGKYSILTFKADKVTEHRHGYCMRDKVNLNSIFYYYSKFSNAKKSFPYTLPRSHLVPVEMLLFKRGRHGVRVKERKRE